MTDLNEIAKKYGVEDVESFKRDIITWRGGRHNAKIGKITTKVVKIGSIEKANFN